MTPKQKKSEFEPLDLRGITQDPGHYQTKVYFDRGYPHGEVLWLIMGQASLNKHRYTWTLKAFMKEGATDMEHDSAYALNFDLIGLEYEHSWYGTSWFSAFIDPRQEHFGVPLRGFDPLKEAEPCTYCEVPHLIVPEGLYTPHHNEALLKKLSGVRVRITMGPPPQVLEGEKL